MKLLEEKAHSLTDLMKPLAMPGSAKNPLKKSYLLYCLYNIWGIASDKLTLLLSFSLQIH